MPAVSVVIATRNRADELERTLGRLAALPERPAVVVVDNGSTDGTTERARAVPGVRVLDLGENRGAAARNAGVRAARSPYVAFCDDDSWWAPGSLARATALLDRHPHVALVAARVLVGAERRPEPTCLQMAASPLPARADLPGPRIRGFVACGAVVRRDAFLAVGGFHPRFAVGGEEALLACDLAAAGWELVYASELVAEHHPSPVRDRRRRRAVATRNDLWFSWLRRPRAVGWRATLDALRDRDARAGLREALADLPWALAHRRPV